MTIAILAFAPIFAFVSAIPLRAASQAVLPSLKSPATPRSFAIGPQPARRSASI
jgi:hypothetical protein